MIIPTALRKVMKEKLHHGHIGIQRTRACARQVMFWLSLNAEITDMISKCSACIENQAYQQKEPLIFHEIPTEPWFKVRMHLFSFRNKSYLVVVDYYSNYIEVCHLYHRTKSPDVISHVKAIFACFGIPRVVISDNGPQFLSMDFKTLQNLGTLSTEHLAQSILRQMEWLKAPLKQLSASSRKLTK